MANKKNPNTGKKNDDVKVSDAYADMSEDELRNVVNEDYRMIAAGDHDKKVKMQKVTFQRDEHIREIGHKVRRGDTHELPESVVAFYARTRPGIFGDDRKDNQADDTGRAAVAGDQAKAGDVVNNDGKVEVTNNGGESNHSAE